MQPAGALTHWDLFTALPRIAVSLDIEPVQVPSSAAPAGSVYMPGGRLDDHHGLLVNLDPRANVVGM